MSNTKFAEYHVPFIKSLVFIAVVTIVSMVSIHYFIKNSLSSQPKSPIYTSQKSQDSTN